MGQGDLRGALDLDEEGATYALEGKQEVNDPEFIWNIAAGRHSRARNAQLDVTYMGHRHQNYTSDESEPGYRLGTLGVDRFVLPGVLKRPGVSLNTYNLFNPLSGDAQTFLIGAPRQFFGTVKVDF